jgi:hypothetical protein
MTLQQASDVLLGVYYVHGRSTRRRIREAWMSGNYYAEDLERWSSDLQNIRNQFGPSWLASFNFNTGRAAR